MTASQRINYLINLKGISQLDLAKMAGVHKNTIQKMIANNTDPSLKVILAIVKHYEDINLEWLILGKGSAWKSDGLTNNLVKEDPVKYELPVTSALEKKLIELESRIQNLENDNKKLYELLNKKQKK